MLTSDDIKSSWADEVELEGGTLPPTTETRENGLKIITEYKTNEEGKKVKIVRTYKIEKRVVSKHIATRKAWPKFGESTGDKPGPDPATTIVGEDVYMQFVTSKEDENKVEDESGIEKLKAMGDKNVVKCRTCSGEHWTSKCPWKDTVLQGGKLPGETEKKVTFDAAATKSTTGSKYIPPNMRDGGRRTEGSTINRSREDASAIRISNLSESTTETDLEELVKPFGPINKLFLARDKVTGKCKGFAYIHFKFRNDAAKAITFLNGYGYDYLILTVDWSKPPAHPNQ